MKRMTLVVVLLGLPCILSTFSMAQSIDSYHAAINRFVVSYSHDMIDISVAIGENVPAKYTLEIWTKGTDVTASVIVDASAPFMLGLAFLEKGDTMTAWWPTIEEEKTFDISQSEEEIGFGMGRLDRVIWHSTDYVATPMKETASAWEYRVTPDSNAQADFAYAVVAVNKTDETLVRADFFDENDKIIETDTVSGYKTVVTGGENTILYPMSFTYEDFTNNKKTSMEYSKIEFPASIDDATFTIGFLKDESAKVLADTNTP